MMEDSASNVYSLEEARQKKDLSMQNSLANQQRQAEQAPKKNIGHKIQNGENKSGASGAISNARKIAKAAGNALGTVKNMFSQIRLSEDWFLVFLVIPFGLLKDIFDIAFAAIPGVGIVLSFLGEIFLLILTVVGLLLASGNLKGRGQAKYILGFCLSFVSEAFPGIGWLPLAFVESILLYGFLLLDRAGSLQEQSGAIDEPNQAQPETQYPDTYAQEKAA